MKTNQNNEDTLREEFIEKYCSFEISERISKPDMENILNFFLSHRRTDYESLLKELEGMKRSKYIDKTNFSKSIFELQLQVKKNDSFNEAVEAVQALIKSKI